MPCGSTPCSSTKPPDGAASPSFPAFGWFRKILLTWLAGLARCWKRQSQYKQLLELDERLLADIGVSRTVAKEVRGSQLYLIAWRDSR